jgi:hypothetical protein
MDFSLPTDFLVLERRKHTPTVLFCKLIPASAVIVFVIVLGISHRNNGAAPELLLRGVL